MHISRDAFGTLCFASCNNGLPFFIDTLCRHCAHISNASLYSARRSYLWKRVSVDGRQVQPRCNTRHASPLVAAELITDGALTARLIRDSRLWIAVLYRDAAFGFASRLLSFLRIGLIAYCRCAVHSLSFTVSHLARLEIIGTKKFDTRGFDFHQSSCYNLMLLDFYLTFVKLIVFTMKIIMNFNNVIILRYRYIYIYKQRGTALSIHILFANAYNTFYI